MTGLKLLLSVLAVGAGFGLLGAFTTLDSGDPVAYGATIGGAFGLVIGAVFAGRRKAGGRHLWAEG
jgi:hypothetical protein